MITFDRNGMDCAHIFYIKSHHFFFFFNMSLVWINLCLHDKTLYTFHVFVILSNTHARAHTHTHTHTLILLQQSNTICTVQILRLWGTCPSDASVSRVPLWWFLLAASQWQGSTEMESEYSLVTFLRSCSGCSRQPDTGHLCTVSWSHSSGWSSNDAVFSTRILCENCQRPFKVYEGRACHTVDDFLWELSKAFSKLTKAVSHFLWKLSKAFSKLTKAVSVVFSVKVVKGLFKVNGGSVCCTVNNSLWELSKAFLLLFFVMCNYVYTWQGTVSHGTEQTDQLMLFELYIIRV